MSDWPSPKTVFLTALILGIICIFIAQTRGAFAIAEATEAVAYVESAIRILFATTAGVALVYSVRAINDRYALSSLLLVATVAFLFYAELSKSLTWSGHLGFVVLAALFGVGIYYRPER